MEYHKREVNTEISNQNTQSTIQNNFEINSENRRVRADKPTISEKLRKDINDDENLKGKKNVSEDLNPDVFPNISMNKTGKKES